MVQAKISRHISNSLTPFSNLNTELYACGGI